MSPIELYDELFLLFPPVCPRGSNHTWESMYDGQSASLERISNLLARHIDAAEVIILVHTDEGIGAILSKAAAASFIADNFLKADIQVSDRQLTCFVEIDHIGVGTGWRKETKRA